MHRRRHRSIFFMLLIRLTFVLGPAKKLRLEVSRVALMPCACEVGELVSESRGNAELRK